MSLEKFAAWGTIVCAVCAPPALFFAAAVFFQWKPETFSNLSIVSAPVGVAIIVLLLGVFPWLALFRYWPRPSDRQRQGLIIDYAGYGLGFGQYRNVTNQVRRFIKDKELHMPVTPASLQCDPYPGVLKHLIVIYSHGNDEGKKAQVVYDERLLELP